MKCIFCILWTMQDNVYPALLCLSAASSRVCNRGQRPNTEGGYKPTWEGPTPCNTASERSSSRAIWGKASPTQPLDLNPSEFFLRPPRAGLRGHTYRLLQGPSRLRRRSGAFSVRILKFWNRLPAHLVFSPSVSIFKKQLDRQWSEIFPAAPV